MPAARRRVLRPRHQARAEANRLPSGGYRPSFAEGSYLAQRERLALLERAERLERFVIDCLKEGWSPEQIAGPPWSSDHGCSADGWRGLLARDG